MSEPLEDQTVDFSLGQDAWHQPGSIREEQYARGINVIPRGAVLGPRFPFWEVPQTFENKTYKTAFGRTRTYRDVFRSGKFQAWIPYSYGREDYFIAVVSGWIFRFHVKDGDTILLSEDIRIDQRLARVNYSTPDGKVLLHDDPSFPIVVDGEKVFRCSFDHKVDGLFAPQVPISRLSIFNQNRVVIATDREITAGDPVGNLAAPEAPITFTELLLDSSPYRDQSFSLPSGDTSGMISAMGCLQQLDTSTGIGSLFVSTDKQVSFFRTELPRDQWTTTQFSGALLLNVGISNPRGYVNLNSDLIFTSSRAGVYALSVSREENKKWGNAPISREVEAHLKLWYPELSAVSVVGHFDNFVFIAANPYRVKALTRDSEEILDYAHAGLVVLDLEINASLLHEDTPVWAGLWTGVNPIEIGTIDDRCFIVSKDGGGVNVIYEVRKDQTYDMVRGKKRRIRSIIYTREYDCKAPFVEKHEALIALYPKDLRGKVDILVERKPAHSSRFLKYGVWSHIVPENFEYEMPDDIFLEGDAPHQIKKIIFGDPIEEGSSPITRDLYSVFLATQLRITIEADDWKIESIRLKTRALPVDETFEEDLCDEDGVPIRIPADFEPDWLVPEEGFLSR